jgi:hypothetical protein
VLGRSCFFIHKSYTKALAFVLILFYLNYNLYGVLDESVGREADEGSAAMGTETIFQEKKIL